MFFDFAGILPEDTMIKRSMAFCEKSKSDNAWAFSCIVRYLQQFGNVLFIQPFLLHPPEQMQEKRQVIL
jgi:hypothetical protein